MKPRIKLHRRVPVFAAKIWICQGFDATGMNWHFASGWTPQQAFENWKTNCTCNF